MQQINRQAMDEVLSDCFPAELQIPSDIKDEWRAILNGIQDTQDRLNWVDINVMRLTFEEYACMIEGLLLYLAIESGVNEVQGMELDIHVNSRYTNSIIKALS